MLSDSVRSARMDSTGAVSRPGKQLVAAMRRKLREVDTGFLADIQTWNTLLEVVQFPSRVATMALGVLGGMVLREVRLQVGSVSE
jgi:hypothetical protein